MATPTGFLSDQEWQWASDHLPIACVDVLPVRLDALGRVSDIGLIRRESPMGSRWCHVGGRLLVGESLAVASARHLQATLTGVADVTADPEPFFVNEYFRDVRPGAGLDPRKHAVATCFLAVVPASSQVGARGPEALEFRWWPADQLPEDAALWPGTGQMINRALQHQGSPDGDLAAYEALSGRHLSHNELMWQTPGLAMTAIAFLLTIALSQGNDLRRALAAVLSAMIALVSAQLMAKHSANQIVDAEQLLDMERRRGMPRVHGRPSQAADPRRGRLESWFVTKRSRIWWFRSLLVFGVVSLGIAAEAVTNALVG